MQLIHADAVIPMEGQGNAILQPAGIAIHDEKILAVAPLAQLRSQFPNIPETYIPGIMLPGLINAHTHLELGYQRAAIQPPASFTHWLTALMRNYPAPDQIEAAVATAVNAGIQESLRAGVTCVGDISRHCALTRTILANQPLRAVSFGEVIGLGKMRDRCEQFLRAAADRQYQTASLTIGLSPHAPYTVEGPTLQRVVEAAIAGNFPLTMHLAELREETPFLDNATGPLADWPVLQNILDPAVPQFSGGPLRWAAAWGLLRSTPAAKTSGESPLVPSNGLATSRPPENPPVLLAHVNYCDPDELALLAASTASVAYCPRTRHYFGHDHISPHPYREMLAAGINVCLGTDSLASNPDLSILREAAFLYTRDHIAPYTALEMITRRAAAALGLNTGTLAPAKLADLIIMPAQLAPDMTHTLSTILTEAPAPRAVWVAGRRAL